MLAAASAGATAEQREALARISDRQARTKPRQQAMSEYQYYEFRAIDRPPTAKETGVLRSYSTRARITPTSVVNEYSWGDFKGDADDWMDKYFDAFLYLANWGTHILKLRLPARLLDPAVAKTYCGGEGASVRVNAGKVILSFHSEDEEGDDWVEGEGTHRGDVWLCHEPGCGTSAGRPRSRILAQALRHGATPRDHSARG
jgi:hypothetical protein